MFDLGFSEIVFIVIVSLLIFKPEDWPEIIKNVSKVIRKIKTWYAEISKEISEVVSDDNDDGDTKSIKQHIKDLEGNIQEAYDISDLEDFYDLDEDKKLEDDEDLEREKDA